MAKNKLNIEKLFEQEFEHFEVQPSEKVWKRIRSDLFFKHFIRFYPNSFNIYYLSLILVAGTIAFLYIKENKSEYNSNNLQQPIIELQVQDTTAELFVPTEVKESPGKALDIEKPLAKKIIPVTGPILENNQTEFKVLNSPKEEIQSADIQNIQYQPNHNPISYFNSSVNEGCVPLRVDFTNHSENGHTYSWNFGDGGSSLEENPVYIFDIPGTYFVSLTVTTKDGNISSYTDSIRVFSLPRVNFSLDKDIVPGNNKPVYFYNSTKGAESYEWNFGDGNKTNLKEPIHYYEKPGNFTITLKARSVNGCSDSMVLLNALADKYTEIVFPNAFSPNINGPSDGYYSLKDPHNGIFHPYFSEEVEEYQLMIFNRKGILVFESNSINIGWDGYYHQELSPQGVYVWKVRGRYSGGRSFVKMGDVTLILQKER